MIVNVRILLALGALTLAAALAGCDVGESLPALPTPRPAAVFTPPPAEPAPAGARERLDIVVFLDAGPTYPRSLLERARTELADWIDGQVLPGSPGFKIIIKRLDREVYRAEAKVLQIEGAALRAPPSPPGIPPVPTPETTPDAGPYGNPQAVRTSIAIDANFVEKRDAYEALVRASLAAYQKELTQQRQELAEARTSVKVQTDQLRTLELPPGQAADLEGALANLQDIFGERRNGRQVGLFVTDLQSGPPAGLREDLSLVGVEVFSAFFRSDSAAQGDGLVNTWKERIEGAGARFTVTDPDLGYSEVLRGSH